MQLRHILLIAFDLISVFLFSGIIFGWAPLNSLLLSEKIFYKELCSGAPPCDEQRAALNRAFTIASTAVSLVALPAGYFVDTQGPIVGSMVAGVLEVLGLVGIALCEHFGNMHFDLFLYSFVLIAVAGSLTMFCGYSIPFLFPAMATLLIESTSCLFDGSCIIFLGFKVVYEAGLPFSVLWWGYAGIAVIIYTALVFCWLQCRDELRASRAAAPENGDSDAGHASPASAGGLASLPLGKQVCSMEFTSILIYATIQVTRSNLFLGTVDLYNEQIADKHPEGLAGSTLTTIVGLIVPFGFLAVPAIEFCVHRLGLLGTLHVTTLLGLAFAAIQVFWETSAAQLIAAALFAIWRAYLFSIISAFVMQTFGPGTMGRIMGLCFLSAAIVNLAQAPLVSYTLQTLKGNFTPLLVGAMVASLPLPIPWLVIYFKQARDQRTPTLLSQQSSPRASFSERRMSLHGTALGSAEPLAVLEKLQHSLPSHSAPSAAMTAAGGSN